MRAPAQRRSRACSDAHRRRNIHRDLQGRERMEDERPRLELTGSRLFTAWLAGAKASLAFTTYQAGKLFLIGLRPDGRLSIFERSFPRCMGLGSGPGGTIWMSSLYQLW